MDVEDFRPLSRPDCQEVIRNTNQILQLLSDHETTATFFCVGVLAKSLADLLKAISRQGHEIGVHGWDHEPVTAARTASFRDGCRRAKAAIEQITGEAVAGYRAPFLSMQPRNSELLDTLLECGFSYSSSVKPGALPRHLQNLPAFRWQNGLIEVPPSSGFGPIPLLGGGYLRHLPFWWSRLSIDRVHAYGRPVVIYTHPYEVECSFPPLRHWLGNQESFAFHLLQSRNRGSTHLAKLRLLLQQYRFCGLHSLIADGCWLHSVPSAASGASDGR